MTELWRIHRDAPAPAATALRETAAVLGDDVVGWLACPLRLRPVRLTAGEPHTPDGPADLDGVFSVRAFGAEAELRWARTGGELGRAVLVTESPIPVAGWTGHPAAVVTTIDGSYALWGTRFRPHPSVPGWCRAAERRTGPIDMPVLGALPSDDGPHPWPAQYLSLAMREYAAADEHGNARVVEERLRGIRTATPTTGATR